MHAYLLGLFKYHFFHEWKKRYLLKKWQRLYKGSNPGRAKYCKNHKMSEFYSSGGANKVNLLDLGISKGGKCPSCPPSYTGTEWIVLNESFKNKSNQYHQRFCQDIEKDYQNKWIIWHLDFLSILVRKLWFFNFLLFAFSAQYNQCIRWCINIPT